MGNHLYGYTVRCRSANKAISAITVHSVVAPSGELGGKGGVVCLQVKLCDAHPSALEVRFSRQGTIQIYVFCIAELPTRVSLAYEIIVGFSRDFYKTILVRKFPSREIGEKCASRCSRITDISPSFHSTVLVTI